MSSLQHFWQGQIIDERQLRNNIENIDTELKIPQNKFFPLTELFYACQIFATKLESKDEVYEKLFKEVLTTGTATEQTIHGMLEGIYTFLRTPNLKQKLTLNYRIIRTLKNKAHLREPHI